jgi:hypothetical protein
MNPLDKITNIDVHSLRILQFTHVLNYLRPWEWHIYAETCLPSCRNWSENIRRATEFYFFAVFVLECSSFLFVTLHVCCTSISHQNWLAEHCVKARWPDLVSLGGRERIRTIDIFEELISGRVLCTFIRSVENLGCFRARVPKSVPPNNLN